MDSSYRNLSAFHRNVHRWQCRPGKRLHVWAQRIPSTITGIIADEAEHIPLMIMGTGTCCQSSFIKSTINSCSKRMHGTWIMFSISTQRVGATWLPCYPYWLIKINCISYTPFDHHSFIHVGAQGPCISPFWMRAIKWLTRVWASLSFYGVGWWWAPFIVVHCKINDPSLFMWGLLKLKMQCQRPVITQL